MTTRAYDPGLASITAGQVGILKPKPYTEPVPAGIKFGFPFVYGLLAVALAIAAFAAGVAGPWKTQLKAATITRTVAPNTGAALVAAWGTPDTQVDGAQVNPALSGSTCAVYQKRHVVVCY